MLQQLETTEFMYGLQKVTTAVWNKTEYRAACEYSQY